MQPPPVITPKNPKQAKNFRLRSLSAIAIGVVGYWLPLWYDSQVLREIDSRLGMVFIYTLPIILTTAIWATCDFRLTHQPRYLTVALLLMAWSPILFVGDGIIRTIFYFAFSR